MANFCLMPQAVDNFKAAVVDGRISPDALSNMTSAERHELFGELVGKEAAKKVNALFESKLLLKHQQQGMITWAKQVTGITPQVRRDLLSRIQKMDRVLDPADQDQFFNDLAEARLGFGVTQEEAKGIADLAKTVSDTKAKMKPDFTFNSEEERLAYGRALVELGDHVSGLKNDANKLRLRHDAKQMAIEVPGKTAALAKSLKATLDNSVIGRQGLKTMFSNPKIWAKNSLRTFKDAWKELGGKDAMAAVKADVLSRPNALNGLYNKEKLALGVVEEAYPSTLPEKIPGLGRAFKASESAFTGFQYRTRADVFDKYVEIANKTGADITGIGKVANALTGRGNIGKWEPSANSVNSLFFSPRLLKSNIDALTVHAFDKGIGKFARKQAAMNTLKIIGGIGTILTIADSVAPGSVEWDSRSSDFGKIKVGNTRFDVTGGMSPLVTLASRFLGRSTKNTNGVVKKLGPGFSSDSFFDVFVKFWESKLSPAASVAKDVFKGEDFDHNDITLLGELKNLFMPLPINTYLEAKNDPDSANRLLVQIADGLGISANTFGKSEKSWDKNMGKELTQFKEKVGEETFKKANEEYNQKVDEWMKKNQTYIRDLPDDKRQQGIDNAKEDLKDVVFKHHGFKYQKSAAEKTTDREKERASKQRKQQVQAEYGY